MSEPSRADIEDFLYAEAALLDAWQLDAWLALWAPDGRYVVPATDAPEGDPRATLALVADDLPQLRARCAQLASGATWAEVPRARMHRMVSNVRVVARGAGEVRVEAKFAVHRFRGARRDVFVGTYRYVLTAAPLQIREKRCVLAHEDLFAQGSVHVLL